MVLRVVENKGKALKSRSGRSVLNGITEFLLNPAPGRKLLAKELKESGHPYFGMSPGNADIVSMGFAGRLMINGRFDTEDSSFCTNEPKKVLKSTELNESHLHSLKPYFVVDDKSPNELTMMYRGKKVGVFVRKTKIYFKPQKS